MEIYLVGGAVRDQLLHLPVKERDWVVVGATPALLRAQGYLQVDANFPVFTHPVSGEEYALARRETKIGVGYKGFRVEADPEVSLAEDLQRRDLTINALAQTLGGQIIDPYGGLQDLQRGVLRHISPAFSEDPLRLLRLARFAARLGHFGFHIAATTQALLKVIVARGELASLPRERVWRELELALAAERPAQFLAVLAHCGALALLLPEIAAALAASEPGQPVSQPALFMALDHAAQMQLPPPVRWGVIAWQIAQVAGVDGVAQLNDRLAVPGVYRDAAIQIATYGAVVRDVSLDDPEALLVLFDQVDLWRRPERLSCILAGLRVWALSLVAQAELQRREHTLVAVAQAADSVTRLALLARGLRGVELGQALRTERLAAIRARLDGGLRDTLI